jgi:chromosomal replication initiation ATPase DnaA
MPKPHDRADRAAVLRATRLAAKTYGVFRPLIFLPKKGGKPVATARQIAQYLAHCSGGVPMPRIARLFRRDISSVQHNISLVEDMRDTPEFDEFLTTLERKYDGQTLA